MRYIPLQQLREGMVLGQSLCGNKFEILLVEGVTLAAHHIRRINSLGYSGAYIADSLSDGVQPRRLLSTELHLNTVKAAKDLLEHAKTGMPTKNMPRVSRERQERILLPVIDAVIKARPRMVDVQELKPFENYNYFHAVGTTVLSLLVGLELGLTGPQLFELGMASLLHDVGTSFIPRHILEKPGKLTQEETYIVQTHAEKGFAVLRDNYDISIEACMGAQQHHENFDGTGYPNGLKGERISIYGRIIALTAVYDALVSRRPYREALAPPEAAAYLREKSGTMFDPALVAVLAKVVAPYPVGTCVELSDGASCMVVQNYPGFLDRPRLRLLDGAPGAPAYLDLHLDSLCKDVEIQEVIYP